MTAIAEGFSSAAKVCWDGVNEVIGTVGEWGDRVSEASDFFKVGRKAMEFHAERTGEPLGEGQRNFVKFSKHVTLAGDLMTYPGLWTYLILKAGPEFIGMGKDKNYDGRITYCWTPEIHITQAHPFKVMGMVSLTIAQTLDLNDSLHEFGVFIDKKLFEVLAKTPLPEYIAQLADATGNIPVIGYVVGYVREEGAGKTAAWLFAFFMGFDAIHTVRILIEDAIEPGFADGLESFPGKEVSFFRYSNAARMSKVVKRVSTGAGIVLGVTGALPTLVVAVPVISGLALIAALSGVGCHIFKHLDKKAAQAA